MSAWLAGCMQVVDALSHLPSCIDYMNALQHPLVFRFCAIPQIMAAGTLALCYNNGRVFEGVVKLRRGQTATIFETCSDMGALLSWFQRCLRALEAKALGQVDSTDPSVDKMRALLASHQALVSKELDKVCIACRAGQGRAQRAVRAWPAAPADGCSAAPLASLFRAPLTRARLAPYLLACVC